MPEKPKIVATYDYRDQSGTLLYQVVRFDPKDFRQRRPVGSGWEWNLNGTKRVLYRLPELMKQRKSDKPVFIVEGEKDVDTLVTQGLRATCNVCGAGKWREEYNIYLYGQDVGIIPDNDVPGKRHAEQVAKSLSRLCKVKILTIPAKDATQYFENGGDKKELLSIWEQSKEFKPEPPKEKEVIVKRQRAVRDNLNIDKAKAYPLWKLIGERPGRKIKCLWHEDKKPSLHLYESGNGYCFVCCKPYSSIDWLIQTQGLSFKKAVMALQ